MEDKYLSRAWSMLTRDKGWFKPLLVMGAATLVPVAGPLGNKGYALEWARLTAWGVDSAPKQKNVDVGKCIASGWRGFVVELGWGMALGLATSVITGIAAVLPGALGTLIGALVSLAVFVVSVAWGMVVRTAEIRAAIYESIGAGYRLNRVFDMIKRDPRGFGKVILINLVCSLVVGLVGGIAGIIIALQFMPLILASGYDDYAVLMALANSIVWIVLVGVIFGYVLAIVGNGVNLVTSTVVALWMRQFDVPAWGRSEDPLPNAPSPTTSYSAPAQPPYQSYEPTALPTRTTSVAQPTQAEPPEAAQASFPEVASPVEPTPEPFVDEPVKDVDALYADLYDVIQRNNRIDDSRSNTKE